MLKCIHKNLIRLVSIQGRLQESRDAEEEFNYILVFYL